MRRADLWMRQSPRALAVTLLVSALVLAGTWPASAAPPRQEITAIDVYPLGVVDVFPLEDVCAFQVEVTYSHRGPGEVSLRAYAPSDPATFVAEESSTSVRGGVGTNNRSSFVVVPTNADGTRPPTTDFKFVAELFNNRGMMVGSMESAGSYSCS